MRVSAETIYQSLYVQSRGALRRDLTKCLRTGRALRRPRRQAHLRRSRIPDMINIAERPAQADDRAVPGHWEGDLILGKNNLSAIGTLVERTTGYTMLVHLRPSDHRRGSICAGLPGLHRRGARPVVGDGLHVSALLGGPLRHPGRDLEPRAAQASGSRR